MKANWQTVKPWRAVGALERKRSGVLAVKGNAAISLQLKEEHGGCWNGEHFTDGQAAFSHDAGAPWVAIAYVVKERTHFYNQPSPARKTRSYLLQHDFVRIEKVEGNWVFASFEGGRR